jgi:membrane-associated phospholipid phosphatase
MNDHQPLQRWTAELSGPQRRVFWLLDHYADAATGVLAALAAGLQLLIGTPGAVVLGALALVLPAGLLTYAVNRLCKALLPKPRANRSYHALISPWLRGSFPSFHTQFAATFAMTFVAVIGLVEPPERLALALLVGFASMGVSVALVAWSRLYLAVHDRVDVYGGVILGVLIGLLVAGVAVTQGWLPGGGLAWALIAGLAALVLAISLWERRKRRG